MRPLAPPIGLQDVRHTETIADRQTRGAFSCDLSGLAFHLLLMYAKFSDFSPMPVRYSLNPPTGLRNEAWAVSP